MNFIPGNEVTMQTDNPLENPKREQISLQPEMIPHAVSVYSVTILFIPFHYQNSVYQFSSTKLVNYIWFYSCQVVISSIMYK